MARFRDQFRQPHGRLGRAAGRLMAVANNGMNRFTADLMAVEPDDRVLEIGFGPGRLIERLAARATSGLVAGVDPSDVMLAQATARNRAAIAEGRVRLEAGTISALPHADAFFTKVCSVNTIYFWPDPEHDLRQVYRVLVAGGRCYLTFRVRLRSGRRPAVPMLRGDGDEVPVAQIATALRTAGFTGIRSKMRRFLFVTAMCLTAEKRL